MRLPKHDFHQRTHAGDGAGAAVDVEFFQRFPTTQRACQPAKPQDVVQMTVGQEDAIQTTKAQTAAQELTLGAFAAVDHEAVFV